jgi:hypothetical protein
MKIGQALINGNCTGITGFPILTGSFVRMLQHADEIPRVRPNCRIFQGGDSGRVKFDVIFVP